MKRSLYKKLPKKRCIGCDYPEWAPSKNINPKKACDKCCKHATKRNKQIKDFN